MTGPEIERANDERRLLARMTFGKRLAIAGRHAVALAVLNDARKRAQDLGAIDLERSIDGQRGALLAAMGQAHEGDVLLFEFLSRAAGVGSTLPPVAGSASALLDSIGAGVVTYLCKTDEHMVQLVESYLAPDLAIPEDEDDDTPDAETDRRIDAQARIIATIADLARPGIRAAISDAVMEHEVQALAEGLAEDRT